MPEIKVVPISSIKVPDVRVSSVRTEEQRALMAQTIKAVGVIQEPVVRSLPEGGYELIAGKGRIEELQAQGFTEVSVKILDTDPKTALLMNVAENVARGGYDYVSVSKAIRKLRELGSTDEELTKAFPWSARWITFVEGLQDLPEDVQEGIRTSKLTPTHIQESLKLPTAFEAHESLRTVMRLDWDTSTFRLFVTNRLEQIARAKEEAQAKGKAPEIPVANPEALVQYGQCLLCGHTVPREKLSTQIACEGCRTLLRYITDQLGEPEKAMQTVYKVLELYSGVQQSLASKAPGPGSAASAG
jgi:ParB family chromosome partitioning protein